MRAITIKEAAKMMGVSEQYVRMAIQLDKIPGAFVTGSKPRRTYWITDTQVSNLMKGARG